MTRVLYIEDDFNNRVLVKRVLMAEGFEVEEADNAFDGIQMARNNPPDIILMDISMPEMDGVTATQQIRSLPGIADLPIVAVTANAMQGDKETFLDAGCNGYISKPIDIDTFVDQVRQYLR
jgi:two-component system cell cycle response regulator DivK